MRARARWLLVGLILTTAAVVAVWPRSDPQPDAVPAAPAPDLAPARAKAALPPCAARQEVAGPESLRGVRVECLSDGSTVDLAERFAGRTVLVNVWATWCEPCRAELPVLAAYAAEPDAVEVVGVAVQSPPADALALLAALNVRMETLLDPDGAAQRALRVPDALPASYVIESGGTVQFITDPRLFRSVDQVRQTVTRYAPAEGSGHR